MNKPRVSSLVALVLTVGVVLVYSSCGGDEEFNFLRPIAKPLALKNDEDAKLEEARVHLDREEYDEALDVLSPMLEDEDDDSNEARLLFAAAKLGDVELDVWSIISAIIDGDGSGNSGQGQGIDAVFNAMTDSVLGTGEERTAKLDALAEVITVLLAAPDVDERKVRNTACLFAGILAVPTLADAQQSLNEMVAALDQVRLAAQSGGTECPNIGVLDTSTASVIGSANNFNLILEAAQSCPFLDIEGTASQLNDIEEAMSNLRANVDLGCAGIPTCPPSLPTCAQLFPPCVQELIAVGNTDAQAGDGMINSCELVLHCTDPSICFN